MTKITVDNLSKSYGELQVIDDLSMEIESGKIVGLLGPNGVGKTTLMEMMSGRRLQDDGRIHVDGTVLDDEYETSILEMSELDHRNELQKHIGVLPEKEEPPSYLTPREYFEVVRLGRDISEEKVEEVTSYWADRLDFEEQLDVLSSDLSRGQQQKVMITQAFLHDPDVFFIDEPLANLDPIIQEVFIEELKDYVERGDKTVIVSTHQVEFALDVCSELHLIPSSGTHELIEDVESFTKQDLIDRLTTEVNTDVEG